MLIAINKKYGNTMIYRKYSYYYLVILNDYFNDDLMNKTFLELGIEFGIQSLTPKQFKENFDEK